MGRSVLLQPHKFLVMGIGNFPCGWDQVLVEVEISGITKDDFGLYDCISDYWDMG